MIYKTYHTPVLLFPLLNHFGVDDQSIIFDGTLGFAGHAINILEQYPNSYYVGFDRDTFAIEEATKNCRKFPNFKAIKASYSSMLDYATTQNIKLTHILLDLGVSSYQIDQSNRGFTFQKDEPLDMRMDTSASLTAKEVLDSYTKDQLVELFMVEGDIRSPEKLVERIVEKRNKNQLNTSFEFLDCIKKSFFFKSRNQYIATATKLFQAIRVEVNNEMAELKKILADLLNQTNITVAIITFQPNEDRLVKAFIKENKLAVVQKKPFMASYNECKKNPREKSAKLRIFYI